MAKPKAVVIDGGYANYDAETELVTAAGGELVFRFCEGDENKVIEAVRDATVVLARQSPVTRRVIESMPDTCRAVVRYGIGYDNVDTQAAAERRIGVANTPGYGSDAVSMHAMGLLLAVARQIVPQDQGIRSGKFSPSPDPETMLSLEGQTIGFLGFGAIARSLHEKLLGFKIGQVLIHDPFAKNLPAGVEHVSVDELCRQSDVISLHAPQTKETERIINADRLGMMKKTAVILNTSRGGLIDTTALVRALKNRTILGAGLDVFDPEPLPVGHPLLECDNVVLTSHIGWCTKQAIATLQRLAAEEAARALRGETPLNWVNRW